MPRVDHSRDPYTSPAEAIRGDNHLPETGKLLYTPFKFLVSGMLVLVVMRVFGILGIVYEDQIENEPLKDPVRVIRNSNEELELADGRLITRFWESDRLAEIMKRYGTNEVEIAHSNSGPNKVEVYAKNFNFICRIGEPRFTIPIIPVRVHRFKRELVGTGECREIETDQLTSEAQSEITSAP